MMGSFVLSVLPALVAPLSLRKCTVIQQFECCATLYGIGCTSVISQKQSINIFCTIICLLLDTTSASEKEKMRSQLMVLVLKFRSIKKYCIIVLQPSYGYYCYLVAPLSLQGYKILLSLTCTLLSLLVVYCILQ